jgi:hypothetical protein
MNHIIIINGYPGSGKDSVVDYLKAKYDETKIISVKDSIRNLLVHNVSSAKPSKELYDYISIMSVRCGDVGESVFKRSKQNKTTMYRNAICDIKKLTDKYFNLSNYYLYDKLNKIEVIFPNRKNIIFIHIRESYNIYRFIKLFKGAFINNPDDWTINTLLVDKKHTVEDTDCSSDQDVLQYKYNNTINNHYDLDYLEKQADYYIVTKMLQWGIRLYK